MTNEQIVAFKAWLDERVRAELHAKHEWFRRNQTIKTNRNQAIFCDGKAAAFQEAADKLAAIIAEQAGED